MNEEKQPEVVEQDRFPLDDATIGLLAEIGKQLSQDELRRLVDQHCAVLNAQRQGALVLFIRQHKLDGNWTVADNGTELVRTPTAVMQPGR